MVIEGLDPVHISKLTSHQVEQVTCIECCKYFIAPETALCGHSLCHGCWKGRRACYMCSAPVDKKALKLNIPLQTLTDHVHNLGDAFEKLFNVKLEEFTLDVPNVMQSDDPTKNVKDWLASSQNHFSGPVLNSQNSAQDTIPPIELSKSKIQIHTAKIKTQSPAKVTRPPNPQEDWDKIEVLPDTEELNAKTKQNVIASLDFEPFFFDDNEYTTGNPRRSSRKKDPKSDSNPQTLEASSTKNSSIATEKQSLKTKQTWNNVKKMRKEFSKLNKKNKSKLNVSIEMCKKAQSSAKKPAFNAHEVIELVDSEKACLNIDDITPDQHTNKVQANNTSGTSSQNYPKTNKNTSNNKMIIDETHNDKTVKSIPKSQSKDSLMDIDQEKENKHQNVRKKNVQVMNNSEVSNQHMPFIKMGMLRQKSLHKDDNVQITHNEIVSNTVTTDTDDIEISIKVGSTITNIVIKNKKNDVQLKVNSDREVQTSLGSHGLTNKNDMGCSPIKEVQNIELVINEANKVTVNKSISTKKNTASADTATAQFEITNSVEKELSTIMERVETATKNNKAVKENLSIKSNKPTVTKVCEIEKPSASEDQNGIHEEMDYLQDIDIFNSGSVKEQNVKLLKESKHAPSEILMPTIKSKKSQKNSDKRNRDLNSDTELPCSKKPRMNKQNENEKPAAENLQTQTKDAANISEPRNYDVFMSQVFANIDADIKNDDKNSDKKYTQVLKKRTGSTESQKNNAPPPSQIIQNKTQKSLNNSNLKEAINQKYSENVFSMLDKDSESHDESMKDKGQQPGPSTTQQHVDNLLTPGMCQNLAAESETQMDKDIEMLEPELGTPVVDHDSDSDKSVVEETPQKNVSFAKPKQNLEACNKEKQPIRSKSEQKSSNVDNEMGDSQIIRSIINISDTTEDFSKVKDTTVLEMAKKKNTLETPLNISKFVNQIKHNSTPVARKSLNFEIENLDDAEETLCPTTTQEKEFLVKAFEKTQNTPIRKPLMLKKLCEAKNQFVVAGSCLTAPETKNLKSLCQQRGWTYLDKYTKDLTHLVVGVDEDNRSQRSVKYMCALADSKWIVTYSWVEKCLQLRTICDELPYEALDASGDPGPKRSRTASKKIFEGISFYCMPPFSVLAVDTLRQMLEASGGVVVDDPQGVKVTPGAGSKPALLLAEPEHTQEDQFVYLAMEYKVVPVNYEWALNCLGSYSLCSFYDLLLCPPSLLPPGRTHWPEILLAHDDYD